jgi:hypothetical protein
MKKNVHITHRKDDSWAVIIAGNQRASSLHRTQGGAIEAGQRIAQNNKVELVIHDRKNRIRDSDSYGHDPNPPKDKKN